jgi:hypothetical protein
MRTYTNSKIEALEDSVITRNRAKMFSCKAKTATFRLSTLEYHDIHIVC